MKRFPVALVVLSLASVALATDTAFWKPYRADGNTYALLTFDEPQPLSAQGKVDGQGSLAGGAELVEDGRFGGGLRLDGTGYAAFSTTIFDPGAMAIHPSNHSFSIEAWIKLDRYAENKEKALVVHRPANNGRSLGFSLFVMHDGALGLSVTRVGGSEHTFISDTGTVPVGKWVHIAGISCGGHLSVERDTLYANGREVFSGSASGAAGGTADKAPADIHVGGSPEGGTLTGRIDEVRVHGRVGKLWPLDPMPWIKRVAEDGLPPLDKVLAPERQPWLMFHFDEQTRPVASSEIMARDPAIVERFKVSFDGKYIPGIRDRGINGELTIDGFRLADWTEGSLECWFRPRGVNNISDRNVVMLNASGLSVYFFNSVRASRGMAFYYRDGEGNLRMHRSGVEIHPGRWFHMTLTWDAETIAMYVNGKRATVGKNGKRGTLNNLSLHRAFEFDELCFYERRLTADEVANRHWSYVDPNRVAPVEWPAPILLGAWRFPSENVILYRLSAMPGYEKLHKATLSLTNADGEEILALDADLDGTMHRLDTPRLAEGFYVLRASVELDGEQLQSAPVAFLAADFAWENNRLGVTDEVFPPFEPVRTDGDTASVVLRDYRMNGFGLWDSVVSQGRELLNGPVRLHYRTVEGAEGTWIFENGSFVATAPHRAEYRARATSPAVNVDTVSEIEMDGMMKVTLRLSPGAERHKIEHLWLDVPLKASEATLMHEDVGTLRQNYSGFVPHGDGTVWRARCKDTR
ncbi:MAG: LamG domain-containing protein, partial [Candidatus Pacebacteria bacterium]|nr:LamG domain-containing protein [Candidatus Paceibacterota bacterium]